MSTSVQEESLAALCPLCHSRPPKYCCPACATRTCSVACVKKHKLYAQCSGRIEATTFVKRSALLSSPATLNRDFRFLTGVERALGTALEEEDGGRGAAVVERGRLEGFLKRSGVSVKWAPRGMKRAMENCTAVSKGRKGKHVVWTVEWIVLGSRGIGEEAESILDRNVSEHASISQAYFRPTSPSATTHEDSDSPLQSPRKKAKRGKQDTSRTRFYLKRVGCPANNPVLVKLDGNKSLSVALRGRVVEEFPTLLVWSGDGDPAGYEIESGALVEVVDEGEGDMEVKAEAEAAPAQGVEATKLKQRVPDNLHDAQESRPDLNTDADIPQTIEPREEPASTGQPIMPKPADKSTET